MQSWAFWAQITDAKLKLEWVMTSVYILIFLSIICAEPSYVPKSANNHHMSLCNHHMRSRKFSPLHIDKWLLWSLCQNFCAAGEIFSYPLLLKRISFIQKRILIMKTRVSKEKILSYALSGTIICADATYVPKSRFNHHMSTAHMATYDHMFYTLTETSCQKRYQWERCFSGRF